VACEARCTSTRGRSFRYSKLRYAPISVGHTLNAVCIDQCIVLITYIVKKNDSNKENFSEN